MINPEPVRHAFADVNGLRLHRLEFGTGTRPLICLHGVTGHAWVWFQVALEMQAARRVIAVDMRGYGESQWSESGSYRTEDHVTDLSGLIDHLRVDQVDLAGSSWGGLVALGYAAKNPDRVSNLAIVDMEPSFDQGETDLFPRSRSFADHAEAAAAERQLNPHAPDSMIEVMATFGTRPGEGGRLYVKHDPYFFERWPFRSDDRWRELRSLELPVLIVHATDSFIRRDVTERMAAETGNGRVVHINDSGHVVPVEQPQVLARTLLDFFGEA